MRNGMHRRGAKNATGALASPLRRIPAPLRSTASTPPRVRRRALVAGVLLGMLLGPEGFAAPSAEPTTTYRVRSGDTLSGIALRHKSTARDIRTLNGLQSDLIRVGQALAVPARGARATTPSRQRKGAKQLSSGTLIGHKILVGDSLGGVAKRYGTTVAQLRADNPSVKGDLLIIGRTLKVRARVPSRKQRRFVYTIQPGDTLSGIGAQFGVSWPQIGRWNPGKDPKRLHVGSRINVYLEGPRVRSTTKGRPQRGVLVNGEQLPPGPGYRRQTPRRAWGTNETITQILRVVADLRIQHPRIHDLLIGDISKKGGGKIAPHVSHQSGRDVDIGYVFTHLPLEGSGRFLRIKRHLRDVDWKASWTLIKALVGRNERSSRVQHVFMSYPVQKVFYEWAKSAGATKRQLEYTFQYPRGRRALAGKIRHVKGHTGHMHVRFKCPPKDVTCVM